VVRNGGIGTLKTLFENPGIVVAVELRIVWQAVERGKFRGRSALVQHGVSVGDPAQIEHVVQVMIKVALIVFSRPEMLLINFNGAGVIGITGCNYD